MHRCRPFVFLVIVGLTLFALSPPASAGRKLRSTTVTVTQLSLSPGSLSAGVSATGTLQLTASGTLSVKSVGIAVRDAAGAHYDYPGAAVNVALDTNTYTYTSGARTFPAGTYTQFGFWQDTTGAYHSLPSMQLVVTDDSTTPVETSPGSVMPQGMTGTWNLVRADEFSGSALDTAMWMPGWFGSGVTGPVNSYEQACYSSDNVTMPGDGNVHLKVTATSSTCTGSTQPYTGALLSSNPSDGRTGGGYQFTYGAVEARVYLPSFGTEVANWPAIWTNGQKWPDDGENDIMEGLGGDACYHFHSLSGDPGACVPGNFSGWHTFASEWQPGSVTYYYDGVKVGSITTGITGSPMYLILNCTVSKGTGATTVAPAEMLVDYVRVWQR